MRVKSTAHTSKEELIIHHSIALCDSSMVTRAIHYYKAKGNHE